MTLSSRHLLGLEGMSRGEMDLVLQTADSFKEVLTRPIKRVPTLTGKTIANLFFEPSTRTRMSFELAERRLSADAITFTPGGSSVSKGESLKDTARNIEAMKVDMVVVRHRSPGAPLFLSRVLDAVVINAGDGAHEHPTQALLDMYTMREHGEDFEGGGDEAQIGGDGGAQRQHIDAGLIQADLFLVHPFVQGKHFDGLGHVPLVKGLLAQVQHLLHQLLEAIAHPDIPR